MRTLTDIRKDIDVLLDEAEGVIRNTPSTDRMVIVLTMPMRIRREVKDGFVNMKQYIKL